MDFIDFLFSLLIIALIGLLFCFIINSEKYIGTDTNNQNCCCSCQQLDNTTGCDK